MLKRECYDVVLSDLRLEREQVEIAIQVVERLRDAYFFGQRYAQLAYGDVQLSPLIVPQMATQSS